MSDAGHIGPYELRGELGRGAMARVWRAWDPNLEREVAIKEPLFDPRLSQDVLEEMARRFVQEGRTSAKLQHPGIVAIYAADVYDGRPAIVMELIEGATLGELLEKGPLGGVPTLDALDQLLDAVGYAHDHGVVHRDIKPDNIFVDQAGRIKLSDFGIAHSDDASATRATMVGTVLGTPGYMSPEQATGGLIDNRSDLFSIGVVGYEMLTGENPFGAGDGSDSTTLLYRIVHEPAPEISPATERDLPADIRPAIMAALNKSPENRPQTAAAFKAMLHGNAPAPTVMSSAGLGTRVQQSGGQRPKWMPYVIAGAACVVVLAIVFGIFSAGGGGGGGGGGAAGGSLAASGAAGATSSTNSPVYIGPSDGKVAIFTNSSADPFQVSDIQISELADSDQTSINNHMGFATVEEAQVALKELEDALASAKAAAEAEAKAQAEAAKQASTATITVVGEDGRTRTETIRLQGNSGRVIADSNSRALTSSDISGLTDAELCIAWNEIIAAETGYIFKNSGLKSYFNSRDWYHPNSSGSSSVSGLAGKNVTMLQNALSDQWWQRLATY